MSIVLIAPASAAWTEAETDTSPSSPRHIGYAQWSSTAELSTAELAGVRVAGGRVRLGTPVASRRYDAPGTGRSATYEYGHWTSRWTSPGFGLTELIPSWAARTPGGSWVQIEVRGRNGARRLSSWDTIARWSGGDARFRRSSLDSQADDLGRVATDTWRSGSPGGLTSWQLRVSLLRPRGSTSIPTVDAIGAMA